MVHIAPLPPWRRRAQRIVGFLLSALGVVVLVIAVIALRQPNGRQAASRDTTPVAGTPTAASTLPTSPSTRPTSATVTASTPSASASTSTATVKSIPLVVLNNTSRTGLAESAAQEFENGGWKVTGTANLVNDILSTCAYYDPNTPGAQAAATALRAQFSGIKRVEPKFSGLPAGPVVVVLTTGWTSG